MSQRYFVGQQVTLTSVFRNEAEELAEPTSVSFEVLDGEQNLTKYIAPMRKSLATWTQIISLTCAGTWRYRCVGQGALIAAGWKQFGVEPEPF